MSQKLSHYAFIASLLVILVGLNIDQNKVSKFCSNSKAQIEQTSKFELKVDFSTTINVLGDFVETIMYKLLATNNCSSSSSSTNENHEVKKIDTKCIS